MTVYQCPSCSVPNSLRTSELRLWEWPLWLFGLHPFVCQACSERFHRSWKISSGSLDRIALVRSDLHPQHALVQVPALTPTIDSYTLLKAGVLESVPQFPTPRPSVWVSDLSEAKQPDRPRNWSLPVVPYTFKSFAVLLLLHFLIGALEFRLGRTAMWVNLLTLVTFIGAVLVFIDVDLAKRASSEAIRDTVILVLRWECLFLALEVVFGFFLGPRGPGLHSIIALFRQQSPWIWMTYAALPVAGALGCSAHLLYRARYDA